MLISHPSPRPGSGPLLHSSGQVLLDPGEAITEEVIEALTVAGIQEVYETSDAAALNPAGGVVPVRRVRLDDIATAKKASDDLYLQGGGAWVRRGSQVSKADIERLREGGVREVYRRACEASECVQVFRRLLAGPQEPEPPSPTPPPEPSDQAREQIQRVHEVFQRLSSRDSVDIQALHETADQLETAVLNPTQRDPALIDAALAAPPRSPVEIQASHAVAVSTLAAAVAAARDQQGDAALAGLIHDIGEVWSGGRGDPEQSETRRLHPVLGDRVLRNASALQPEVRRVVLEHHERPDGQGWPRGLSGEGISPLARLVAVCDRYDELRRDLDPHTPGPVSPQQALDLVTSEARDGALDTGMARSLATLLSRILLAQPPA